MIINLPMFLPNTIAIGKPQAIISKEQAREMEETSPPRTTKSKKDSLHGNYKSKNQTTEIK